MRSATRRKIAATTRYRGVATMINSVRQCAGWLAAQGCLECLGNWDKNRRRGSTRSRPGVLGGYLRQRSVRCLLGGCLALQRVGSVPDRRFGC